MEDKAYFKHNQFAWNNNANVMFVD